MQDLLWVAVGGGTGSVVRYLVSQAVAGTSRYPVGTLAVNVAGSFIVGLLAGALATRLSGEIRLGLVVGFLGGFTTFSTFTFETMALLRAGDTTGAMANVAASLVLGLAAAFIGFAIGDAIAG